MKNNNTKIRLQDDAEIMEWVNDLYLSFRKSAEGRKEALQTLDDAIKYVAGRDNPVKFFKFLKDRFLESELKH